MSSSTTHREPELDGFAFPPPLPSEAMRAPVPDDVPRRKARFSPAEAIETAIAVLGATAFALTLRMLLDWGGVMGTVLWAYVAFLGLVYLLARDRESPEVAADRVITTLIWSAGAVVIGVLTWMVGFLALKGSHALRPGFFTNDLSTTGPLSPGGGALHAIIGSFEQVGLATVVVVPVAVMTAVYLHEIRGRMAGLIRFIVDAMSGLPSVVAGLLVFTVWIIGLKRGFSGAAGSTALAILMLPTVTRTAEEILRTVPDQLREASLALGAPQWRTVLRIVLPTARSGLVTAAILGVARAVGETAPVLLTAFGSDSTNTSPFNGPQANLPLFVWKLIRLPNNAQKDRAWTGAFVLVVLVLALFTLARWIGNRGQKKLGRSR